MSMFDKIKGMMGVPDDDDYDDDDMDFVNENTGYAAQDDYVPEEQDVTPKRNKVVNIFCAKRYLCPINNQRQRCIKFII